MLFNVAYLVLLIAVRMIIPRPKRGIYKFRGKPNINLLFGALGGIITKARYQPPFPGFLVQQFANIQPFRWLLGMGIGPRTQSSFFLDPELMDPWALTIGKNVNIGYGTVITAHIQEFDYIMVDPVIIEDNVMIGAHSAISCGVHIKKGAYLEPYTVVKPGVVIGECEHWAGRPAFKKGYYRATGSGGNGEQIGQASENASASAE
jgi:acetyltransferase-like isoleucine patch superfamily enzyme